MTTLCPAVENELNECDTCPDCNEELEKSGMPSYFGFCYKCQRKVTHDEVNAFNKGIEKGATLQAEYDFEEYKKLVKVNVKLIEENEELRKELEQEEKEK